VDPVLRFATTNNKFLFNWWINDKDPSLRWRSAQDDKSFLGSFGGEAARFAF
jgi:hypothetical protein